MPNYVPVAATTTTITSAGYLFVVPVPGPWLALEPREFDHDGALASRDNDGKGAELIPVPCSSGFE